MRKTFLTIWGLLPVPCVAAATFVAFATFEPASAASSSVFPHIEQDETAKPYVAISGLQSWIVEDRGGNRRMVFTTDDGMTLEGPLFDREGRDLTAALLGSDAASATSSEPAQTSGLPGLPPLPQLSTAAEPSEQTANTASSNPGTPATAALPAPSSLSTDAPDTTTGNSAQTQQNTSEDVPVLAQASDAGELLKQAGWFTAWFSAGKPKPDAPVLYFMADPTCIHCAASTDKLAPLVEAGDLDLRIILAPIRSNEAVYQAASIIQDPTPAATFVAHERAMMGSASSPLKVRDPQDIEPDVVRALQRNVAWGRTNNVQGVPFWIYHGQNGPAIAAGRVTDQIIQDVQALPREYAMEANQ